MTRVALLIESRAFKQFRSRDLVVFRENSIYNRKRGRFISFIPWESTRQEDGFHEEKKGKGNSYPRYCISMWDTPVLASGYSDMCFREGVNGCVGIIWNLEHKFIRPTTLELSVIECLR